jgi:hypothetical protein
MKLTARFRLARPHGFFQGGELEQQKDAAADEEDSDDDRKPIRP